MYTREELEKINPSYCSEHFLTSEDVGKVNDLVMLIQAARLERTPKLTDGDKIICISPKKGVVSDHGHIQERHAPSDFMTICTDPYVPFIDISLRSDASGGYWVTVSKSHEPLFKYKGKTLKTFKTLGHMGLTRNGAINFQAEVNLWEFEHEYFY